MPRRLVPLLLAALAAAAGPAEAAAGPRLPARPVVSASVRGGAVIAGGRWVAVPRRAVRLEAITRGGRIEIALGSRRWTGPARGGIRLQGRVRVSDALGTGRGTAELIAHRLLALAPQLRRGWAPDGSAPSGRIRRTRDWKRGFYAGALWRAIEAAPDTRRVLAPLAWRATRALWGGETADTHDVGFIFGEADGGALRAGCARPSRDCARAAASLRRAAATLHRLAAATPAGVIPVQAKAGCRICGPDDRKVFIDSAMNLTPLLSGTAADRDLATHHLDFLSSELARPDGSTTQQLVLSATTGEVARRLGHDPLAPGSTWARGEAWAVHGFAAAGGRYAEVAGRLADWIASRPAAPGWDWAKPAGSANPLDLSAAAIAAAGLQRTIALGCTPARCAAWRAAAARLLHRATAAVSARAGELGRFAGQRYLWDPSRRIDYRGEYLMGTDYLLEALASSRGSSSSATTRSTASGR